MPYKVEGNNVLHYKDGKWSVKQRCKNHSNAVAALRLLEGLESGTIDRDGSEKSKKVMNNKKKAGEWYK